MFNLGSNPLRLKDFPTYLYWYTAYLRRLLFTGIENVSLDEYTVHVVAGVLKLFFRQLAVPVIAADFYTDFIRTSGQFTHIICCYALYTVVSCCVASVARF